MNEVAERKTATASSLSVDVRRKPVDQKGKKSLDLKGPSNIWCYFHSIRLIIIFGRKYLGQEVAVRQHTIQTSAVSQQSRPHKAS